MYNPNSSTVGAEHSRHQIQKSDKNVNTTLQQRLGTVSDVHPTLPMIKATFPTGYVAAGDDWIPVGHSVLDIIQRFGALRKGLRVMITFSGDTERDAIATIVGIEGEALGAEISQMNDITTNEWEIYRPSGF
jgi:hypothetical protein